MPRKEAQSPPGITFRHSRRGTCSRNSVGTVRVTLPLNSSIAFDSDVLVLENGSSRDTLSNEPEMITIGIISGTKSDGIISVPIAKRSDGASNLDILSVSSGRNQIKGHSDCGRCGA